MTFGWLSAAAARASARKRRRNASSDASAGCSTLTATLRSSVVSSARKTCADAPLPMGATSRYRPPSRRPVWSCMRATTVRGYRRQLRVSGMPRAGWGVRFKLLTAALLLVAVLLVVLSARYQATPDKPSLVDAAVQGFFPARDTTVPRQSEIGVDLVPGWDADLRINGVDIPEDEERRVEGL